MNCTNETRLWCNSWLLETLPRRNDGSLWITAVLPSRLTSLPCSHRVIPRWLRLLRNPVTPDSHRVCLRAPCDDTRSVRSASCIYNALLTHRSEGFLGSYLVKVRQTQSKRVGLLKKFLYVLEETRLSLEVCLRSHSVCKNSPNLVDALVWHYQFGSRFKYVRFSFYKCPTRFWSDWMGYRWVRNQMQDDSDLDVNLIPALIPLSI